MEAELIKLGRYPLLVVDEVLSQESSHGGVKEEPNVGASLIITSNKPFGRWGEVFGNDVVAAAMIDRLVHHTDVISLKGDSYRL